MDERTLTQLLEKKIEWMGQLYESAKNCTQYQWVKAPGIKHRCGGDIFVYVETTGIGYVCEKCQEAEVL
jgi:hypothetical protein